ncbi:MAG: SpoIIE family protein phosphatase [Verrucomicrobiae bacterium]|nr:SpoIIE family protein phosphatase [Verrucomicrobiae bacterium]
MSDAHPAPTSIVRYEIPADPSAVPPLRDRFIDTISNGELTETEITKWKLVFSELVFNAIVHGAENTANARVGVEWCIAENAIVLGTCDPGKGPPDELLDSPPLPDPTAESGRGLYLIAGFADEIRRWRGPSGFRIEVVKHYPGQGLPLPCTPELDAVLDELSSCYESLSAFHRLTENLIGSSNVRTFISHSLEEFIALHPHDRIFIQGAPGIPEPIRRTLGPASWFLDPDDAGHTLKELGNLTRETVWESHDDLVRQNLEFPSLRAVGAGCVFPIVTGGTHFGAMIVLRKNTAPDMRFRSLGTLRTLADLCGIACANAHLTQIRDAAQRDLRELEIAVEIQKSLLPILPAPVSDAWSVFIRQESALTVAGDYAIARTDAEGNLVTAIIDVMGKGVSAALLASIFRTAFEMSLQVGTASGILETINRTLCRQLGELTMFVTCAVTRVAADGRTLDHASAGHCPTFFYQKDGARRFLEPSGPPLGIFPDTCYAGEALALRGGERLIFVTDGCYEWDRHERALAWDNFVARMDEDGGLPAADLWHRIRERIRAAGHSNLEDDCTLLTIDISA